VAGLVPTALVLPVVKLMDTGFRAPWCSKCQDSGLVGLGVAMRVKLCEVRMRIGLRGDWIPTPLLSRLLKPLLLGVRPDQGFGFGLVVR
jgi:hypothetical protein